GRGLIYTSPTTVHTRGRPARVFDTITSDRDRSVSSEPLDQDDDIIVRTYAASAEALVIPTPSGDAEAPKPLAGEILDVQPEDSTPDVHSGVFNCPFGNEARVEEVAPSDRGLSSDSDVHPRADTVIGPPVIVDKDSNESQFDLAKNTEAAGGNQNSQADTCASQEVATLTTEQARVVDTAQEALTTEECARLARRAEQICHV
ncbi:hypothetical protein DXG03_009611, partial [Asterophora parasitica]